MSISAIIYEILDMKIMSMYQISVFMNVTIGSDVDIELSFHHHRQDAEKMKAA